MKLPEQDILAARILIVDDQAANVQLLERVLKEAGYTDVQATMNPMTVCPLHRQHDFDLILLDLQLPLMDGFQVMAALRANSTDDYLPVLVLTAQPGHKLRALKAGARDFVSKPFDLIEVSTRIRNMLEVRLLYRRLEAQNLALEHTVQERTAELRESEARFRSLAELASDWYWEQDEHGAFTKVSGPVLEMLGIRVDPLVPLDATRIGGDPFRADAPGDAAAAADEGWNEVERAALRAAIQARRPFLDFAFSRQTPQGTQQHYRVSGEPMFGPGARFIGYRGIGVETTGAPVHASPPV